MPASLPLKLQLYILKLAAPLHEFSRRQETLKSCSLVHRSWTTTAQKLLFQTIKRTIDARCGDPLADIQDDFEDRLRQKPAAASTAPIALVLTTDAICGCMTSFVAASINASIELLVVCHAQAIYLPISESFSGVRSLMIVGKEGSGDSSRLDLPTFATAYPDLEELGFSDVTVSLYDYSAHGIRPCLRLTRLHLRNGALHFERSRLQQWAPNLEVLVSYNSEPDKNFYLSFSILSSLPPTLRSIVYVESFASLWLDFVNFRPVQYAPTLELFHLVGQAETDRRGQLSARDAVSFNTMRDRVGAYTGGPSLDIKLEWISNRKKSADELYEEIAERYKLLR